MPTYTTTSAGHVRTVPTTYLVKTEPIWHAVVEEATTLETCLISLFPGQRSPPIHRADVPNLPVRPSVKGFRVARTRGTTRWTQRFERRGLYAWDLDRNETRRRKPRDTGKHNARQRGTPSFTQVQGPCCEVKPLIPAFLYYDTTPREEYKVLVTEL
jgi:hypothetical protein